MDKYKFRMIELIDDDFHYINIKSNNIKMMKRVANECASFNKSLPVIYESSIFVAVDELNVRHMRIAITGPDGTPYDSCIYFFDILIPEDYPNSNPEMHFVNNGGVIFNPNLYSSGKVCLSLLGTWRGTQSESWNPKTSTLMQLFISVQSQILVNHPYFNEPGYEKNYGTVDGDSNSQEYNNYVRYYNMKYAMLNIVKDVQQGRYKEFKDMVLDHFKVKKDYILEIINKWTNEAIDTYSTTQQNRPMSKKLYVELSDKLKDCFSEL